MSCNGFDEILKCWRNWKVRNVRTRRGLFRVQRKTYSYDHENMGVSVVSVGVDQVQAVSGWSCKDQRHIEG